VELIEKNRCVYGLYSSFFLRLRGAYLEEAFKRDKKRPILLLESPALGGAGREGKNTCVTMINRCWWWWWDLLSSSSSGS
jgi:hypothetical protein